MAVSLLSVAGLSGWTHQTQPLLRTTRTNHMLRLARQLAQPQRLHVAKIALRRQRVLLLCLDGGETLQADGASRATLDGAFGTGQGSDEFGSCAAATIS